MDPREQALYIKHEDEKLRPYFDCCGKFFRLCTCGDKQGKLSLGIGRNIEDNGIRTEESRFMLQNDDTQARFDAHAACPTFAELTPARAFVLTEMAFNIGLPRLLKFEKMLAAVQAQNWAGAADEMLDSVWAKQVGGRAQTLSQMMRSGEYPT